MNHVAASPSSEVTLAGAALRRWSSVSAGTAIALTWAQFAGILHPHHPAFFLFVAVVVAFYIATPVAAFLVVRGLLRIAQDPEVRTRSAVRPFVLWASGTVVVVVIAIVLGGVR